MEPTTIDCSSACTVTVVHELSLAPLQLTPEDGGLIAVAIVTVWAVGFAFRMLIRALNTDRGQASDAPSD